jgi:hypothetical protein
MTDNGYYGLFASVRFEKGDIAGEYLGEKICR